MLPVTNVNDCAFYGPNTDETFFNSEEDDDAMQKSILLLQYTLDSLYKIFLYDTQRFLSKERADALLVPLVDQVGCYTCYISSTCSVT